MFWCTHSCRILVGLPQVSKQKCHRIQQTTLVIVTLITETSILPQDGLLKEELNVSVQLLYLLELKLLSSSNKMTVINIIFCHPIIIFPYVFWKFWSRFKAKMNEWINNKVFCRVRGMRALPRAARWKRREVNLLELTSGYRSRGNSFVALGVARHLSFSAEGVCLCRWHWDCAWRWKINANHSRFIFIVHLRWCGDNSGPVLMLISPCGDGSVKQGGWLGFRTVYTVLRKLSFSSCLFVRVFGADKGIDHVLFKCYEVFETRRNLKSGLSFSFLFLPTVCVRACVHINIWWYVCVQLMEIVP